MRRMALALILGVFCVQNVGVARAQSPLGAAFTYQGELAESGAGANGVFDLRFRLYDAEVGGNQVGSVLCSDNLVVVNGRFSVSLDFGAALFAGQRRFLEIEVRPDGGLGCADGTGYTALTPRQELTATPNAMFAQAAGTANSALTANNASSLNGQPPSFYQNAANLSGTLADARLSSNVARLNANQTFTGQLNFTNVGNTFAGSGAGLTNLNGGSINAGTLARSSLTADVQSGVGTLVPDLSLAGSVATGTTPSSVAVSGSFAYVVIRSSNTLQVFDISNPAAAVLVGSVATGSNPVSVAVSGSFVYVANNDSHTLQVFNVSNPAAPSLAGSVATGTNPASVAVSGAFAYVVSTASKTLQVFNIGNPAAPTLAGSVGTGGGALSVAVSGSFACVANYISSTLQVFNISNPAAPTLAGNAATGSEPYSVAVSGSFAYVVSSTLNTLEVFNISDPASPTLAGSAATGFVPYSVAVSGSFAYVVNAGSSTLQVFNVINAAAPTLSGSVATGSQPNGVAVSGPFVYVANGFASTLQVFNTRGVGFSTPLASSSLAGVSGSGLTGVNAASLNGRGASFYTDASNITAGTLAESRLSANIPRLNANNTFVGTQQAFEGGGGIRVGQGIIQKGGSQVVSGSDLGLYSQVNGEWIRFVTNNGQFLWFSDSGAGTNARMILSPAGNLSVTGSLSKGGGSFKIDHPLDPKNKYLYHSFVESPDMMNIYNGNVTTDEQGYATIALPDYFEALNRDFRYQLTVIDENDDMEVFLWAKVVREVKDNQFTLRSSRGSLKVSWQVTGVRKDAWAEKNRIPNSVDKVGPEKGKYLHPEAFGKSALEGVHAVPVGSSQRTGQ